MTDQPSTSTMAAYPTEADKAKAAELVARVLDTADPVERCRLLSNAIYDTCPYDYDERTRQIVERESDYDADALAEAILRAFALSAARPAS